MNQTQRTELQYPEDSVLKEYFVRYLKEIRNTSDSTAKHYIDALNNISRFLKQKELVCENVYELTDIESLLYARDQLYADPDFIALDTRGHRMYSSGLNNYCRFAQGEGFSEIEDWNCMDVAIEPQKKRSATRDMWGRSTIIRDQIIAMADYSCEMDSSHESFTSGRTNKRYMEGHHVIPMRLQNEFNTSLDVYANIISLCPVCHRKIHYGLKTDRTIMLNQIYEKRNERLMKIGIYLGKNEFTNIIIE